MISERKWNSLIPFRPSATFAVLTVDQFVERTVERPFLKQGHISFDLLKKNRSYHCLNIKI